MSHSPTPHHRKMAHSSTTNIVLASQSFDAATAEMNLATIAMDKVLTKVVHGNCILGELMDALNELDKGLWSWGKPKMTMAKVDLTQLMCMGKRNRADLAKAIQGSRIAAHTNLMQKKKVVNTMMECVVLDLNMDDSGFPKCPISTMVRKELHKCSVNGKVVGCHHQRVGEGNRLQHVIDFCDGEKGFMCTEGDDMDALVDAYTESEWHQDVEVAEEETGNKQGNSSDSGDSSDSEEF